MQIIYMHMPELPHKRHIITGDIHIINTAAPESNVLHRVERRERPRAERKKESRKERDYMV